MSYSEKKEENNLQRAENGGAGKVQGPTKKSQRKLKIRRSEESEVTESINYRGIKEKKREKEGKGVLDIRSRHGKEE